MTNFYLYLFDAERSSTDIRCPSCSHIQSMMKDIYLTERWAATCESCGAIYGVGPQELFECYVKNEWASPSEGKRFKAGELQYVDFVVLGGGPTRISSTRWHGWVNSTSRRVVQVG